jgi:hypothetical protein
MLEHKEKTIEIPSRRDTIHTPTELIAPMGMNILKRIPDFMAENKVENA